MAIYPNQTPSFPLPLDSPAEYELLKEKIIHGENIAEEYVYSRHHVGDEFCGIVIRVLPLTREWLHYMASLEGLSVNDYIKRKLGILTFFEPIKTELIK